MCITRKQLSTAGRLVPLVLIVALGQLLLLHSAVPQPPERLYVTVVGVEGDVEVKFPERDWIPVKPGMKLQEGVELRTGPFSHADLVFADNSIATVDSFSDLVIDSFVRTDTTVKTHIKLMVGTMTSTVNRGELVNDYEVITPTVTASVRGTQIKRITAGALYGDSIEMGDHGLLEYFDDLGRLHSLLGGEESGAELTPDAPVGSTETTDIADSSPVRTHDLLNKFSTDTADPVTGTGSTSRTTYTDTGALSTVDDTSTVIAVLDNTVLEADSGNSGSDSKAILDRMFSSLENFKVKDREIYSPSSWTIPERSLYAYVTKKKEATDGGEQLFALADTSGPVLENIKPPKPEPSAIALVRAEVLRELAEEAMEAANTASMNGLEVASARTNGPGLAGNKYKNDYEYEDFDFDDDDNEKSAANNKYWDKQKEDKESQKEAEDAAKEAGKKADELVKAAHEEQGAAMELAAAAQELAAQQQEAAKKAAQEAAKLARKEAEKAAKEASKKASELVKAAQDEQGAAMELAMAAQELAAQQQEAAKRAAQEAAKLAAIEQRKAAKLAQKEAERIAKAALKEAERIAKNAQKEAEKAAKSAKKKADKLVKAKKNKVIADKVPGVAGRKKGAGTLINSAIAVPTLTASVRGYSNEANRAAKAATKEVQRAAKEAGKRAAAAAKQARQRAIAQAQKEAAASAKRAQKAATRLALAAQALAAQQQQKAAKKAAQQAAKQAAIKQQKAAKKAAQQAAKQAAIKQQKAAKKAAQQAAKQAAIKQQKAAKKAAQQAAKQMAIKQQKAAKKAAQQAAKQAAIKQQKAAKKAAQKAAKQAAIKQQKAAKKARSDTAGTTINAAATARIQKVNDNKKKKGRG